MGVLTKDSISDSAELFCGSGPGRPASWTAANRWGLEGLQIRLGEV